MRVRGVPEIDRPRFSRLALLFLACTCSLAIHAGTANLGQLSWLAGCWADENAEQGCGETWTPPAGGTMLGVGRTVKAGRTVQYEFLQVRASETGALVYVALPSGQRQTEFDLLSGAGQRFVFENLRHNFPQRIVYTRQGNDRLTARIEGSRGGQLRGFEFQLRRTACTAER